MSDTPAIPVCWKCASAVLETRCHAPIYSTFLACNARPRIRSWEDAKRFCPLLLRTEIKDGKQ